jgi:hypothetical protein
VDAKGSSVFEAVVYSGGVSLQQIELIHDKQPDFEELEPIFILYFLGI